MSTSVWLFKPRSHGRKKEATRARNGNGPRCRGGHQVFACPIDRRLRLCVRVGTQHLFVVVRRRSCVVSGAWSSAALLLAAVLAMRARAGAGARCAACSRRRARVRCCPVAAAAAAAACVLRLSRRRARVAWRVRARRLAWRARWAPRRGGAGFLSRLRAGRCVAVWAVCVRVPCSCARDVVDAAAGRRRRGRGRAPMVRGACSRRCRLPAWHGSARRGGGVGVALAVDAVVGRREDVVNLSERGDCLVEVEAKCDEVVDRGLRDSSPGADSDDSEAACEVPRPRGAGGGRRDPGEDGRVWAWGVGEPEFVLVPFVAHLALQVGVVWEGELDCRDRPGGAVNEERIGPQEGRLVWCGRDGTEGSLPVDAVAPGCESRTDYRV